MFIQKNALKQTTLPYFMTMALPMVTMAMTQPYPMIMTVTMSRTLYENMLINDNEFDEYLSHQKTLKFNHKH